MSKLDKAIEQVLFENNIPNEWSSEINNELDQLKSETNSSRTDLTDKPFITIDGKDAKDFDDAVFCENKDSNIILWVAIADVAEIVAEDSKIDLEAFKRGTSIYFPKNVVPMLPEKISNNLCSLVPNEKRNVLVCKIKFHDDGEINSYEFIEAFISSQRRFTYSEVSNYDHDNEEISHSLESLKILTNKLLKKRAKRNALEIQSQDPLILIDEHGEIESISIPKRLFAHQMIEESMISANICAADFMKKNYGYGVYRVHEEPEFLKIESLKNFFSLKGLSYSKELNSLNLINAFINHANKNQESKIFNILILQSLKRAKYSTQEIGHFGLQLEKYSHFTSPIRRYPDLITHRLIKLSLIHISEPTRPY